MANPNDAMLKIMDAQRKIDATLARERNTAVRQDLAQKRLELEQERMLLAQGRELEAQYVHAQHEYNQAVTRRDGLHKHLEQEYNQQIQHDQTTRMLILKMKVREQAHQNRETTKAGRQIVQNEAQVKAITDFCKEYDEWEKGDGKAVVLAQTRLPAGSRDYGKIMEAFQKAHPGAIRGFPKGTLKNAQLALADYIRATPGEERQMVQQAYSTSPTPIAPPTSGEVTRMLAANKGSDEGKALQARLQGMMAQDLTTYNEAKAAVETARTQMTAADTARHAGGQPGKSGGPGEYPAITDYKSDPSVTTPIKVGPIEQVGPHSYSNQPLNVDGTINQAYMNKYRQVKAAWDKSMQRPTVNGNPVQSSQHTMPVGQAAGSGAPSGASVASGAQGAPVPSSAAATAALNTSRVPLQAASQHAGMPIVSFPQQGLAVGHPPSPSLTGPMDASKGLSREMPRMTFPEQALLPTGLQQRLSGLPHAPGSTSPLDGLPVPHMGPVPSSQAPLVPPWGAPSGGPTSMHPATGPLAQYIGQQFGVAPDKIPDQLKKIQKAHHLPDEMLGPWFVHNTETALNKLIKKDGLQPLPTGLVAAAFEMLRNQGESG